MRIINKTEWDTKHLMSLINAVIRHEGYEKPRAIRIETKKSILQEVTGTAYRFGNYIIMRVPMTTFKDFARNNDGTVRRFRSPTNFPVKTFAQVLMHELSHLSGVWEHKDMVNWWEQDVDFTKDFAVLPKEIKQKPKKNLILERYQKALGKVREKESIIKRNQILLKKWQKKVRYYEKRCEK